MCFRVSSPPVSPFPVQQGVPLRTLAAVWLQVVGGLCKVELGVTSLSLLNTILLGAVCITVASPRECCSQCHSREDTEAPGEQAAGTGWRPYSEHLHLWRLEGQSWQSLRGRTSPYPVFSYPASPKCGLRSALPLWFSLGALKGGRPGPCALTTRACLQGHCRWNGQPAGGQRKHSVATARSIQYQ